MDKRHDFQLKVAETFTFSEIVFNFVKVKLSFGKDQ